MTSNTPFAVQVRQLAKERGTSVARIAHAAWDEDVRGTSPDQLKKVLAGDRPLSIVLAQAVAAVLDIPPDTFPEYRLALARELFNEESQGLEAALANLSLFERALATADVTVAEPEAELASGPERHLQTAASASSQTRPGSA